jgi:hypothetical protein
MPRLIGQGVPADMIDVQVCSDDGVDGVGGRSPLQQGRRETVDAGVELRDLGAVLGDADTSVNDDATRSVLDDKV